MASCDDNDQNGDETDIDCGGSDCDPCGAGAQCSAAADCASLFCDGRQCVTATCTDGLINGDESAVDCGGECVGCGEGGTCLDAGDCDSEVCDEGACTAPTCADGIQNADETDIDCGGDVCDACGDEGSCDGPDDCASGVCSRRRCMEPRCTDRVLNGEESDLDCGGPACDPCGNGRGCAGHGDCESGFCNAIGRCGDPPACDDARINGDESDIDCGGSRCAPCNVGRACREHRDCATANCVDGTCGVFATCSDGVVNGEESDIDCGGPTCGGCLDDQACSGDDDCALAPCEAGRCGVAPCENGALDGTETDVDCGGDCLPCPVGRACELDVGCESGRCADGTCAEATCDDGFADGAESDVDCGGPDCDPCPPGSVCRVPDDCTSLICVPDGPSFACLAASCDDGIMNGDETHIDCGGACGGEPCPVECAPEILWVSVNDTYDDSTGTFATLGVDSGESMFSTTTPGCGPASGTTPELVFRFRVPTAGVWRLRTVGEGPIPTLYVLDHECATGAVELACVDDVREVDVPLGDGQVVFIVVEASDAGVPPALEGELLD